jgi:hypothetical protein
VADHDTLLKMALKRTEEFFHQSIAPELLSTLPPLRQAGEWRSWGPPGIVGVFYQTPEDKRRAKQFERQRGEPYPGLLTTDPKARVAMNISGSLEFFASNRIEGRAFRVHPTASFTLWQHAQVFRERLGKHIVYRVPLAFILGVRADEPELEVEERLQQLIDRTIKVWQDLYSGA